MMGKVGYVFGYTDSFFITAIRVKHSCMLCMLLLYSISENEQQVRSTVTLTIPAENQGQQANKHSILTCLLASTCAFVLS